ncbi:phage major capsid protein [Streptomyces vastus]|uniref:Phage capsid-like C-terminal domain-containing protein n=1 Tax=Streptomyces vastus TaxID=285451 RepID=A0ABN3R2T1_9ACTN
MSSELIKTLHENRQRTWNEAKALADRVDAEKRGFSGEEERQWLRLMTDIDEYDQRIQQIQTDERSAQNAAAMLDGYGRAGGVIRNEELRSWARGQGGRQFEIRHPGGPVDFRTLSKLSAGAGGSVVPQGFYNRLMAHLIESSGVMQAGVTVLNTTSGETIPVPKTTAHSSGALVAEAGTIATSDPAFGSVDLGAYKYGAKFQVSTELLTDTGVDLEGYFAMQAGRALGNAFGVHALTGTGSAQPRGILTDSTAGATGATGLSGGFGAQETADRGADYLISLFYSVIAPYRMSASCRWMMADGTAATIRKIKDATNGQYVWQPSTIAGQPDLLLNKPVVIDPNVPAIGLSAKSVLFGDFSQYFVRIAGGVRFERSDDFAFDSDLVTFRALMRADAAMVDLTGAIKHFVGGAS